MYHFLTSARLHRLLTDTLSLLFVMNDKVNIRMEREGNGGHYISKRCSLISRAHAILHPVLLIPTFAFSTR